MVLKDSSASITVNGLNIHYAVQGQGPPALLLHGYAHSIMMWERPVNNYLKKHYRCYMLDLPGHGDSETPPLSGFTVDNFTHTVQEFCSALGLKSFLLCGYSMGGLIGLDLALSYPPWVDKLVLINAPVKGDFFSKLDFLLRLEKFIDTALFQYSLKLYKRFHFLSIPIELNRYGSPKMLYSESFKRVQAQLAYCSLKTLFGSYKLVRFADLSGRLTALKSPTLLIASEKDRVIPPAQSEMVHAQAPHTELRYIPGGHLPLDEYPNLFDTALKSYLGID